MKKQNKKTSTNYFVKVTSLATIVSPFLFFLLFTIAGFLRPGYSPVAQAISDLGIGTMPWLLNIPLIGLGIVLVAFAYIFVMSLQSILSRTWRIVIGIFLAGPGAGYAVAGIFDETNPIHWQAGMPLLAIGSIIGFFLVGFKLRRHAQWRRYANYSVITSIATLFLIIFMNMTFFPGSELEKLQIGGLMERIVFAEILAWYIVMGLRLFRNRP